MTTCDHLYIQLNIVKEGIYQAEPFYLQEDNTK